MAESEAVKETGTDGKFYNDGKKYWEKIPPTIEGMLGGYQSISSLDIAGSDTFLRQHLKPAGSLGRDRAIDCGAGIGRITKKLLTRYFESVDLVEVTQSFLDEARDNYLGPAAAKVTNYFCSGLETFTPDPGVYDAVWCQWVLGQVQDAHLVQFFIRCKNGLKENGIIFVKENVNQSGRVDFDINDSSYCRPKDHLVMLFKQAGLTILKEEKQRNFPKELYEVWMFALQ